MSNGQMVHLRSLRHPEAPSFTSAFVFLRTTDFVKRRVVIMSKSSGSKSAATNQSGKDKNGLTERDGCLGIVKKDIFTPLTNFVPRCVGFVKSKCSGAIGFLIKIVEADEDDGDEEQG